MQTSFFLSCFLAFFLSFPPPRPLPNPPRLPPDIFVLTFFSNLQPLSPPSKSSAVTNHLISPSRACVQSRSHPSSLEKVSEVDGFGCRRRRRRSYLRHKCRRQRIPRVRLWRPPKTEACIPTLTLGVAIACVSCCVRCKSDTESNSRTEEGSKAHDTTPASHHDHP